MRKLRLLLLPFSLVYGLITFVRNKLFDWGFFSVYEIPIKSISVGNLSVGGTGKTPHVAYLTEYLSRKFEIAILSRGYGRDTKGYIQVSDNSKSKDVGDEPLLYFSRFIKNVKIIVCESRKAGIIKIKETINPNVVILDDAFQHRKVKAGLSILLTDFSLPYCDDFMLPAGNLREYTDGKNRADILVVTKCPEKISVIEKNEMISKLQFNPHQVYFSKIVYGSVLNFENQLVGVFSTVLLVTGIANPIPLQNYLSRTKRVELMKFPDHHNFTYSEIQKIHTKFDALEDKNAIILTTEKDFMRLKFQLKTSDLDKYPWCYIPITIEIDREEAFIKEIDNYVNTI